MKFLILFNKSIRKRNSYIDVIFNHLSVEGLQISITMIFRFINRDIGTVVVLADAYQTPLNKAFVLFTCDQSDVRQLLLVQIALHDS